MPFLSTTPPIQSMSIQNNSKTIMEILLSITPFWPKNPSRVILLGPSYMSDAPMHTMTRMGNVPNDIAKQEMQMQHVWYR